MNRNSMRFWEIILILLLLISTGVTIILQVLFSGPTSTRLETSLFSILQFVFSLAFAWVFARLSLRNEFRESQKNFAISAYRRIIEINSGVERLISRTASHLGKSEQGRDHELEIVNEIGLGIRESIRSSISDWADIIGDEIAAVQKIQSIREARFNQLADESLKVTKEDYQKKLEKLFLNLPNSLRIATEDIVNTNYTRRTDNFAELTVEENSKGYIELWGYHEEGHDIDIFAFNVGEVLYARIGDDNLGRIGVLMVFDQQGRSVGVIENRFPKSGYRGFTEVLFEYLGKSEFPVEILSIRAKSPKQEENDSRHYFSVMALVDLDRPKG